MIARNIGKVQQALLEKFETKLVEDWMFDTSEDFVRKHGEAKETEIKECLKRVFPEEKNSPLLT